MSQGPVTAATFPLTHEEAERLSPYEVARVWADRMAWPAYHSEWTPETSLRELAAMSALAAWTTRWQGVAAHRALHSGASLHQVALAIGHTPKATAEMWRTWAAGQVDLYLRSEGGYGLDPAERDQVAAVIAAELQAADVDHS